MQGQIRRRVSDSSDEGSSQLIKRERLDLSTSFEELVSSDSNSNMADSNEKNDDIINQVIGALSNPRVLEHLSGAFAKQITLEINADVQKIKKQGEETVTKVNSMDRRLDEHDQKAKESNAIITGLNNDTTTKDEVTQVLNEELGTTITTNDIDYIHKLKNDDSNRPNRMRIAFANKEIKNKVFKLKKKLKGKQIWLADDLTPYRDNLAFKARNAMKQGQIFLTWVHDNKVFIQKSKQDRPFRIKMEEDIPK